MHDAQLLREGRLAEIDCEYVAEELEDMGAAKERELESRLGVLMAHLLKWIFQPERRGNSWIATIKEQRQRVVRLLRKNPSLKSCPPNRGMANPRWWPASRSADFAS